MRRCIESKRIDLLNAVQSKGKLGKTRIMYSLNVNWAEVKSLIEELEAAALIAGRREESRAFYFITDLGRKYLSLQAQKEEMLKPKLEGKPRMITAPVTGLRDLGTIDIKDLPE